MGRRSKLTPDRQKRIVNMLAEGVTQTDAAYANGIDIGTHFRWMNKGDPDHDDYQGEGTRYCAYREAVQIARGEAGATYALFVRKAAQKGNVQAAMWWLDRARPEEWAQRKTVAVEQTDVIEIVWGDEVLNGNGEGDEE